MSKSVSNEAHAEKLQDRQKLKEEQHASDIAWLLDDVRGRRLYWTWLERCHVFQTSFTGNSETFFREGERNIGLKLIEDMNIHSPDAYGLMAKESANELKKDREIQAAIVAQNSD